MLYLYYVSCVAVGECVSASVWCSVVLEHFVLVHLTSKFTCFYLVVQSSYFVILTAESDVHALPLFLHMNIYVYIAVSRFFSYFLYIIHMDFIISH